MQKATGRELNGTARGADCEIVLIRESSASPDDAVEFRLFNVRTASGPVADDLETLGGYPLLNKS